MIPPKAKARFRGLVFLITVLLLCLIITTTAVKAKLLPPSRLLIEDLILRGDYERALDHLIVTEFKAEQWEDRFDAAMISARLYELADKRETAVKLLERFVEREQAALHPAALQQVRHEQARLFLLDQKLEPAKYVLSTIGQVSALTALPANPSYQPSFFEKPKVLATLSAILPGSGQIVQGRPLDALSSWVMIGLPLGLAVFAKERGEHAFSAASASIAVFFYLGGIAASYRLADNSLSQKSKRRWTEAVHASFQTLYHEAAQRLGFSLAVGIALD